ncbi:hypothetical protein BRDID11002_51920 [Bradyrhizobium diazoefficiens]
MPAVALPERLRYPSPRIRLSTGDNPWLTIAKWRTPLPTATTTLPHEQTYEGFIKLVKYGTASVALIVILMAIFLT